MKAVLILAGLMVVVGGEAQALNVGTVAGTVVVAECPSCSATTHGCYAALQTLEGELVNVSIPNNVATCADLLGACVEVTGPVVNSLILVPSTLGSFQIDGSIWGFVDPGTYCSAP